MKLVISSTALSMSLRRNGSLRAPSLGERKDLAESGEDTFLCIRRDARSFDIPTFVASHGAAGGSSFICQIISLLFNTWR